MPRRRRPRKNHLLFATFAVVVLLAALWVLVPILQAVTAAGGGDG